MAVGTPKDLHTSNYHGNEGSEGDDLALQRLGCGEHVSSFLFGLLRPV